MVLKALLTGGSGVLGTELIKLSDDNLRFYSPSSSECNILNEEQIQKCFREVDFTTVVHCAALTNVTGIEKNPFEAVQTNIVGTINILRECARHNRKLVFNSN